ncbi:MAG: phytanoyl-CoA dioxygenase family protein [Gammaproteobacteria bacterium]|nr:phytanoyl-CoA dioxygenase family protein [Gammaproteobacteria bacterium]
MNNRYDSTMPSDEICGSISADGFAIIENAIDTATLAALKSDLGPYLSDAHEGHDRFFGQRTKRFGSLIEKSQTVQKLLMHPLVLSIADHVLLPYCANYHIHYTGVMQLQPGEKAQVIHRDTGVFPFANPSPPLTVATMWAINDFTAENGGTLMVPGSHLWNDDRVPMKKELNPTTMAAGSVLVYVGNVLHGGGANNSDDARLGVALHYGLGWLRQEENQYLAVPPEQARNLPDGIQELMGYRLGAPSLGFVDHVHPKDHLHGVRDPAKSDISSEELRAKTENLQRFHVTKTEVGRSQLYEPEE